MSLKVAPKQTHFVSFQDVPENDQPDVDQVVRDTLSRLVDLTNTPDKPPKQITTLTLSRSRETLAINNAGKASVHELSQASSRLETTALCCYSVAIAFGVAGFFMPALWIAAGVLFTLGLITQYSGVALEKNQEITIEHKKVPTKAEKEQQLWKDLDESIKLPDFAIRLGNSLKTQSEEVRLQYQHYWASRLSI